MKLYRPLSLLLIVLLGVGLAFGGAIHSSLHGADDGNLHGDADCTVCHLSLSELFEHRPTVSGPLALALGQPAVSKEWASTRHVQVGAPRGPPI
ncbi:MAG: hypothetical protein ACI8X5_003258 [Planctomycetota bacterium]|jgi:hypothetical protein